MSVRITIRARVNENVTEAGVGYVESVEVTGAGFLEDVNAIRDIAQEAVESYHGTHTHNQEVRLGWEEWDLAENKDNFTVRVVQH